MSRVKPGTLLVILMVSVPLIVGGALVVAFLMVRSGVGLLPGVGGPFVVAMLLVGVLGAVLASAARKQGGKASRPEDNEKRPG